MSPQHKNFSKTSHHTNSPDVVAIVGIGCRFSGGVDGPRALWDLLTAGREALWPAPERIGLQALVDPVPGTPGKVRTAQGGFLEDVEGFDAAFFGISPREADRLDPQQRLPLMVAWEALMDAGLDPATLRGTSTGVFLGLSYTDYFDQIARDLPAMDPHVVTGGGNSIAPARLSYALDARGPSLTIDTACSASLVAVHLAARSLLMGECPVALAGGVSVLARPASHVGLAVGGMLAADGRCKAFDASGDGFVRSEGVGVLVLKRLSDAQRDGDRVYALVRGTGTSCDGAASGQLLTPSVEGQALAQRMALAMAGLTGDQISYVEAHGTGTRAGDPIEVKALTETYGQGRQDTLRIGSIKTNIGHTEPVAGVASVIKVALSLYHQHLPASLNFNTPNPAIPWAELPIQVQTRGEPWRGRFAAINSFALGGQNAHAVLEAPPPRPEPAPAEDLPQLLPIESHAMGPLRVMVEGVARELERGASLRDATYTGSRRPGTGARLGVVAQDGPSAAAALRAWLRDGGHPDVVVGEPPIQRPKVVFVFPGQGAQWTTMGMSLYQTEPAFRARFDEVDAEVKRVAGWSVLEELQRSEEHSRLDQLEIAQPSIFAVQVSLAALWESWGVVPDAVIGHSMGEAAAAVVAGAISPEDGIRLVSVRTRLIRQLAPPGAMAAAEIPVEEALSMASRWPDALWVGGINGPTSVILTGTPEAIDAAVAEIQRSERFARKVRVDCASHSPHMDLVTPALTEVLADLRPQEGGAVFYSTVTGAPLSGLSLDTDYWCRNLRKPVLFQAALERLAADGHTVFLEVGHHPMLVAAVRANLQRLGRPGAALAGLRRLEPERPNLLRAAGTLRTLGLDLRWSGLMQGEARLADWPPYAWNLERYWYDRVVSTARLMTGARGDHPMLGALTRSSVHQGLYLWTGPVGPASLPMLNEHRVGDAALFPTTGYVELLLAAARRAGLEGRDFAGLRILNPLTFPEGADRTLQVVVWPEGQHHRASVSVEEVGGGWTRLVEANLEWEIPLQSEVDLSAIRARCPSPRDVAEHRAAMAARDLHYGPQFSAHVGIWRGEGEALAELDWPVQGAGWESHPGALDSALQVCLAAQPDGELTLLPVALGRVCWRSAPSGRIWVHATVGAELARVTLVDEQGEILALIDEIRVARLESPPQGCVYTLAWRTAPAPPSKGGGRFVLLPDGRGVAVALRAALESTGAEVRLEHDLPALSAAGATVIDLRGLDATSPEDIRALLPLAHALDRAPAPLVVVTAGAAHVPQAVRPLSVAGAAVAGMARVLAAELPGTGARRIDLDPDAPLDMHALLAALNADDGEDEVALRSGERYARRLVPAAVNAAHPPAGRRSFRWEAGRGWVACARPQPGPGQVGLRMIAAAQDGSYGLGRVTSLGGGLERPAPGEAVLVMGAGLRARDAVVDHHLCWRAPEGLPELEAAALPGRWRGQSEPVERVPGPELPLPGEVITPDSTWIITGGMGGIGAVLARGLRQVGVRGLVLVGRSAAHAPWMDALAGAELRLESVDVGDRDALRAMFRRLLADPKLPPVRGVVHAAGVLDDGVLSGLDEGRLLTPLRAKIDGALNLHALSLELDLELDHMVLFSSVAGVLGSAAQAGYAAANSAVDALGFERARLGLPATVIAWGAWSEVGLAAQDGRLERLAGAGMGALKPQEGEVLFRALLRDSVTWTAALKMDVARWRAVSGGSSRLMDELVDAEVEGGGRQGPDRLRGLEGDALRDALLETVLSCASAALQQPPERFRPDLPLRAMGLDSLIAVQVKARLEAATGLSLPAVTVLRGPSPAELTAELAQRWAEARAQEAEAEALAERVDDMDEAELDRLLAELGGEVR